VLDAPLPDWIEEASLIPLSDRRPREAT